MSSRRTASTHRQVVLRRRPRRSGVIDFFTGLPPVVGMAGQEHLWGCYTHVGLNRGNQVERNSGRKAAYDEGYEAVFPHVTGALAWAWS